MTFKNAIPGWVVGLVIIITATVTLAAVVKTQTALTWTPEGVPESPKSFGQIFFPGITAIQQAGQAAQAAAPPPASSAVRVPTIVAGAVPPHVERGTCTSCHNVLSPRGAAMPLIQLNSRPPHDNRGLCTNCHLLANSVQAASVQASPAALTAASPTVDTAKGGAVRVPTVVAGAVPPHAERGTCTSCHNVLSPRGAAMPAIQINSRPPHDNRGLCTNCHVLGGASAATAMGAAATPAGLTLVAGAAPVAGPAVLPAAEGGWNGVEVTPVTPLTSSQYGVPLGTAGLIIAEAETAAAVAGVKAGDVVVAVNGSPTATLTDFFRATGNGTVSRGTMDLIRRGQRFQAVVDASVTTAPVAPFAALAAATPTPAAFAPPVAATAVAPPEGEWLGLEVAPISSITATQYNLPPGLPGLLVVEAEAQAATVGAKAGDVLQFVNGVPTLDMTKFFMATKNGTVAAGTIVLWRKGEQMVTRLGQAVAAPPAQVAAPMANSIPAAQMTPYGQAPPNWAAYPQAAWPGAAGPPPAAAAGQGTGWYCRQF